MADQFGVDAQAAARTATELAQIRATVTDLGGVLNGQGSVTGSARIRGALNDFVSDSSDARERMDGALERAAGMLSGLATGATTLDGSLAEAITVEPTASTAQPAQAAQPVGRAS